MIRLRPATALLFAIALSVAAVLFAIVLPRVSTGNADDGDTVFRPRVVTIGAASYSYRVFVPANWSKDKKWPVILFLHGAVERGANNISQTRIGLGPLIEHQPNS